MEKKQPVNKSRRLCNSLVLLLRQFLLILGKNFLLQFRRPIGTIVELLVPIFAVGVIMVARLVLLNIETTAPTQECFVTFPSDPLQLGEVSLMNIEGMAVYYAPSSTEVQPLADILRMKLNNSDIDLVGVTTQAEFEERARRNNTPICPSGLSPGIYFENVTGLDIRYTIRMRPEIEWNTQQIGFNIIGARTDNPYLREGFMQLEKLVNEAIYEWKTGTPFPINVEAKQLPYPKYERDSFLTAIDLFLTLFYVMSLIYTAGVIVKELVLEKETRVKETMKMMGLSNWILTSSWFLKQWLFLFFPAIVITLFLKYGQIYAISDGFLILVFLMFYITSGIAFCFFVSVWFTSARLGLMAGMLAWFVFYFPYFFLSPLYETLDQGTKIGVCLLPNTCVGLGARVISELEIRDEGLQFNNFASPLTLDDEFHMGWVVLMFFIDTVLYMTLYWYIDAVKPGKYGTPRPFYFPFLPSYWCGKSVATKMEDIAEYVNPHSNPDGHEPEPTGLEAGISIKNLTKIYNRRNPRRRKVAVNDISLNMYKGQITALLGHNGAGKTTTMSMLTGLYTPTFGTALVDGYDITTDMDLIRRNLGICPQHNVLFDRLTVYEHLAFFSLLKGLELKKVSSEVNSMIEDLQLVEKRKVQSQNLSGGMKRKLSVGIALVGGSKIVVLDEPTSGMDPYARRGTWDLLTKHKEGRTMLLTTHFMDEADLLGDRIAIMAEGQIKCSGSSLFLKSRYGVGYHLTIVKESSCDSMAVSGLINQHISGAEMVTDVGAELSYILPSQSIGQFPTLFDLLDSNKKDLGVSSFGVSVTTMEEVFIKVGQGHDETLLSRLQKQTSRTGEGGFNPPLEEHVALEEQEPANTQHESDTPQAMEQLEIDLTTETTYTDVNTGIVLWCQQFIAMLIKRSYNFIRFYMNIVWQLVIPLIFVLLSLVFAVTVGDQTFGTEPSRRLNLANSALSGNRTFFMANFEGNNFLDFNVSDLEAVGITNYVDYTNDILQLNSSLPRASTTVQDCCEYEYQILDNFCASRTPNDFMDNDGNDICSGTSFGYNHCSQQCLRCTTNISPTCSFNGATDDIGSDNFCSRIYRDSSSSSGPLDDINIFIDERLLRLSGEELDTNDFFLRIQGGFVISSPAQVPSYNPFVCGDKDNVPNIPVGLTKNFIDGSSSVTVWYNNQPFHMAASSVNAFYSLVLRRQTQQAYTITVTNDPLPLTNEDQAENANDSPIGFAISTISIFGLSFLFASFILFPIEERNSKAKHLQFVSGVQASSYWTSAFIFDLVNAFVVCVIVFILFAAFNVDGFKGENLGAIFLILVLTSWAAIPLTYIFSFGFSNSLIGFASMILFHYILALIFQIIVLMVRIFDSRENGDIINYIALVHPIYALGAGLSEMYNNQITRNRCLDTIGDISTCRTFGFDFADSVFEFKSPAIGHIFLYLFIDGLLFIVITILMEREFFLPELRNALKRTVSDSEVEANPNVTDSDVIEEKNKVRQLDAQDTANQAVVIDNLMKIYNTCSCDGCMIGRVPKLAVNNINLVIPKGECFGLLGVNGAGKTTTFKMLTGDITPTSGTALISGYDIKTQLRLVQQRVGYCPQFDAIIDRLTGRELLTMFARLRGVPEKNIPVVVQNEIVRLDLTKHANRRCGTYSGGNKRKLSTAIALVGDPPIVLLDEPTTGMDPATRRFLWNALIKIVKQGKSVILTTHSMEECEALCTRLAIMVNGQFKCLGSLQHLKSKFGSGFTLQMRIDSNQSLQQQEEPVIQKQHSFRSSFRRQSSSGSVKSPTRRSPPVVFTAQYDTTALKEFVNNKFRGALLLEEHQGAVTYQLPSEGVTWSYMFSAIEQNRSTLHIVDYSVSQTTLDQIFINFAKEQFVE